MTESRRNSFSAFAANAFAASFAVYYYGYFAQRTI